MMRRFATLSAATLTIVLLIMVSLVGAFWGAAAVGGPAPALTQKEVSRAITLLERSFTAPYSEDAGETVRAFAERQVGIHLTEETAPWRRETRKGEPEHAVYWEIRTVLDTAYQTGNIRSQLATGKPGDDPYAGWLMVFKAYEDLQSKYNVYLSFEIESLKRMERQGTLKVYAERLRLGLPKD